MHKAVGSCGFAPEPNGGTYPLSLSRLDWGNFVQEGRRKRNYNIHAADRWQRCTTSVCMTDSNGDECDKQNSDTTDVVNIAQLRNGPSTINACFCVQRQARELVMGDSLRTKTIRFDSVPQTIRFYSIRFSYLINSLFFVKPVNDNVYVRISPVCL